MPRFVQFLAGFFLVCPGLIMWGLGLLSLFGYASGIPGLILDNADRSIDPGHFYFAGISAAILAIGYAMMGTFDLLTHKRRYDIPECPNLHRLRRRHPHRRDRLPHDGRARPPCPGQPFPCAR